MRRVMVASIKSGSGKTMASCALLRTWKKAGQETAAYKCGPDYIDPMFHQKAAGVPSRNLDTFFTGEEKVRELLLRGRTGREFAVLEGAMGLFDGLGGVREEGSSYHLAKVTKTPILLTVDAKGMGRSILSLIAGVLAYDSERLVKGVILNRISASYHAVIKPLAERELGVPVVGYFTEKKEFAIGSRHLGLCLPGELAQAEAWIEAVTEEFKANASFPAILEIAGTAGEICGGTRIFSLRGVQEERSAESGEQGSGSSQAVLEKRGSEEQRSVSSQAALEKRGSEEQGSVSTQTASGKRGSEERGSVSSQAALEMRGEAGGPVIAVAKDEAFCFYYEDNLWLLREMGAKLEFFSPLHDEKLPEGCCGLLLGGGYPELHAEKLSANGNMRAAIKAAVESGMPAVAECGGFLYLHKTLAYQGKRYPMAGVLPAACYDAGRSVRFGYLELEEKKASFLPEGQRIRGHEFHYFDSEENGDGCIGIKPLTGKRFPCVVARKDQWFGFAHLYYPSNPSFAERFVGKAAAWRAAH